MSQVDVFPHEVLSSGGGFPDGIKLNYGGYACCFCSKVMRDKTDMRRHTRTHTGVNPYACPYCDYRCKQKGALKAHTARCPSLASLAFDMGANQ